MERTAETSPIANQQFVDPKCENTGTKMEILEGGDEEDISVERVAEMTLLLSRSPLYHALFKKYPEILYLVYSAALLYMFPTLIEVAQLKFQNETHSVFETHTVFVNMAVVGYIVAIPMSVVLFGLKAYIERSTTESFCTVYYIILRSVFFFISLLVPISFVLVLYLPSRFNIVGYVIILTLFLVVVASSFSYYIIKWLGKRDHVQNLANLEKNDFVADTESTFKKE
ncbi:hypothetical protein QVD17_37186 [Tagetes erecta]|uniref:Uncharacterized protein n=1 Tax=Tagetes erecta TaxID=13708 RepID=A0AAD8JTS7_TARER|nr:hypothetical protein QVD17_37186 [Tagetes erecta]